MSQLTLEQEAFIAAKNQASFIVKLILKLQLDGTDPIKQANTEIEEALIRFYRKGRMDTMLEKVGIYNP